MVKKILLGILVVILLIVGYAYMRTRPSGDINDYKEYFADDTSAPSGSNVKVTFFGVSTLLIDDGETQLLIDGFFSRPSMMTVLTSDIRSDTTLIADYLKKYDMSRVKGIFVTHSHYDHAFDAGYVAKMTGATLYGSESTLNIGRGAGADESQLKLYEINKDLQLGNFTIRVVPSKHSPGISMDNDDMIISEPKKQPASFKSYPEGGAFDFLVSHHGKTMYIKPSPNFIAGALDSLDVDAVLLGIATISKQGPEWTDQFYHENVTALEPSVVIPIHWDNFFTPISDELVLLPKMTCEADKDFEYFIQRTKADNIDFRILQGTKSIQPFK